MKTIFRLWQRIVIVLVLLTLGVIPVAAQDFSPQDPHAGSGAKMLFLPALANDRQPAAAAGAVQEPASIDPVPWEGDTLLPEYVGAPAEAQPIPPVGSAQNPFMAPNPFSHDHNDTWMSDTYDVAGPLGREPEVLSNRMTEARRNPDSRSFMCPGVTADRQGRLVLSCTGKGEWSLVLVDPVTLEVLAYKQLPISVDMEKAYGASYLYLDNQDRAVVPVANDADGSVKILVYQTIGSPGDLSFELVSEYDVTAHVPEGDNINGVLPDWDGRIWFVVRNAATVGVLDPATGSIKVLPLEGKITNTFAMDRDAAYINTTEFMYRIELDSDGALQVAWRETYQNIGIQKPGQLSAGSGTTPTILGNGKYVAMTDNADQVHVVVFRTETNLGPNEQRIVCEVPVFKKGKGADENSLIGSGLSLIAYNTFGYDTTKALVEYESTPSEPGIARVDINPDGTGCKRVWKNDRVELIDTVQKLSTATGLVYAVTREWDTKVCHPGDYGLDVYYLSAIDFSTGKVVWKRLMGTGYNFDAFGDLLIGPNGIAYMPEYGGVVAVRDTP
jgi:hypothetical protein